MSRFLKLLQTIWHCQYNIVWVPKYRYKVLSGENGKYTRSLLRENYWEDGKVKHRT